MRFLVYCIVLTLLLFTQELKANDLRVGPNSDYKIISEAISALEQSGMKGHVNLLLEDGQYNEQIEIQYIQGMSENAILTIKPMNGASGNVEVFFSPTTALKNYTVKAGLGSFISLKGLTISSKGTGYSTPIQITGVGLFSIDECLIIGKANSSNSTSQSLIFSDDRYMSETIEITNCELEGGSFGFFGGGMADDYRDHHYSFQDNTLTDQSRAGIYIKYLDELDLIGNLISSSTESAEFEGIAVYNIGPDLLAEANIVNFKAGQNGIHIANSGGSESNYSEWRSNSITLGLTPNSNGFYLEGNSDYILLDFNRVKFNPGLRDISAFAFYKNLSSGESINLVNNIFYNLESGGYTVIGNTFQKYMENANQSSDEYSTKVNGLFYERIQD